MQRDAAISLVEFAMPRSVKADILYPFATLSLIAVVFVGIVLSFLVGNEIETRMRDDAVAAAAESATAVLQPEIAGLDLQAPLLGTAYDQMQQVVSRYVLSDDTMRLRIYNRDGAAVYSSDPSETGRVLADEGALAAAFDDKTSGVAGNSRDLGDGATGGSALLRVYTPLRASADSGIAAAVEIDRDYSATAAGIASTQRFLYLAVGLGLLVLWAVLQAGAFGVTRALAKDHARLTYFYQTGEHVRSSLDLQEVLTQVVRDSNTLVQGRYSMVCLADQDSGIFAARATFDRANNSVALHQREVSDWLFHRVLATGKSIVVATWKADYNRVFCMDMEKAPMSLLCAPMTLRDKVTGVIAVLRHSTSDGFSPSEVRMLEELAAQSAMAVEQANLFAKVRSYAGQLELTYDATLKALSAALDAKDAATEGHSERVASLTTAIARELDVPEEKLVDIERGALLHDVGKIGVPDAVLRKPRTLSRREWQAMQRHPLLAGILVSKIGFLEGALPILLYHHERYDGKGYPFGLAADRIPLEARIFAVVDAYDAMTSDRPYRKAIGHAQAIQEIETHSGTQFDPAVVEGFLRVIGRFAVEPETEGPVREEEAA